MADIERFPMVPIAEKDAFEIASKALEVARAARLEFVVFPRDARQQGDAAPLARLLWEHIPEMAERAGVPIDRTKEGHPEGIHSDDALLRERTALDMTKSRVFSDWLDHHITDETKQLFKPAYEGNLLDRMIDANARSKGEGRADLLEVERLTGRKVDDSQIREVEQGHREFAMRAALKAAMYEGQVGRTALKPLPAAPAKTAEPHREAIASLYKSQVGRSF